MISLPIEAIKLREACMHALDKLSLESCWADSQTQTTLKSAHACKQIAANIGAIFSSNVASPQKKEDYWGRFLPLPLPKPRPSGQGVGFCPWRRPPGMPSPLPLPSRGRRLPRGFVSLILTPNTEKGGGACPLIKETLRSRSSSSMHACRNSQLLKGLVRSFEKVYTRFLHLTITYHPHVK